MKFISENEVHVAVVMRYLLNNPQIGYAYTIDGVVHAVDDARILKVCDDDGLDVRADWSYVYAITKEADEKLRGKHSAKEFYSALIGVTV